MPQQPGEETEESGQVYSEVAEVLSTQLARKDTVQFKTVTFANYIRRAQRTESRRR